MTTGGSGAAGDDVDEETLVVRAQEGHIHEFEVLLDRYQDRVYQLAYRMTRQRQLAEDLVQDSFIAVWRKLPTLAQPGAFRGWLYQIVTFRCLDALRRLKPQSPYDEAALPHQRRIPGSDPAQQSVQRAQLEALETVLAELTAEQRLCWLLREVHGLSYEEMSEALGVSEGTVRGRLNRSRQRVTERMAAWR